MDHPSHPVHVKRHEIDREKWDRCIEQAPNGRIYAYSDYLDQMTDHWDALIEDDYKTVMPLPWKKKGWISYIYQPSFTASLGIFGKAITQETILRFLNTIPSQFQWVEMDLNSMNMLANPVDGMITRTNLLLPLNKPYEELRDAYRDNTRRDVAKAISMGCFCKENVPVHDICMIAMQQMSARNDGQRKGLNDLEKLYSKLYEKKQAVNWGLFDPAGHLIVFSHERAYYILAANTPESRQYKSAHCILDHFIRSYAGTSCTLDFEGSDLPNLSFFYRSFGARPEYYPFYRRDRLPAILKWLRRWRSSMERKSAEN
jgi:hypothetical protein